MDRTTIPTTVRPSEFISTDTTSVGVTINTSVYATVNNSMGPTVNTSVGVAVSNYADTVNTSAGVTGSTSTVTWECATVNTTVDTTVNTLAVNPLADVRAHTLPGTRVNTSTAAILDTSASTATQTIKGAPEHDTPDTSEECVPYHIDEQVNSAIDSILTQIGRVPVNHEYAVNEVMSDLVSQVSHGFEQAAALTDVIVRDVVEELVSRVVKSAEQGLHAKTSDHMYAKVSSSASNTEREKSSPKRAITTSLALGRKRRSARVKVTSTKYSGGENSKSDEKDGKDGKNDHMLVLEELIPSDLLEVPTPEHGYFRLSGSVSSMGTDQEVSCDLRQTKSVPLPSAFVDEEGDVRRFLVCAKTDGGVIGMMRQWMYAVSALRDYRWPEQLVNIYIDVYESHKSCYQMPNIFTCNHVENDALSSLLWMELKILLANKHDDKKAFIGKTFERDFTYWQMIVHDAIQLPTSCVEFSIRYYYMASQYYLAVGQPADTVNTYRNLLEFIETLDAGKRKVSTCVTATTYNDVSATLTTSTCPTMVTIDSLKEELLLLERVQSLDELQTVYDSSCYSKVLQLLTPTFDVDINKRFTDSRYSQLLVLLKTVDKTDDVTDSIKWLGLALQELVHHAKNSRHGNWAELIIQSLTSLCSKVNSSAISKSPPTVVVGIVRSCLSILRVNTSALDDEKDMPVRTVLPWILLSKLAKFEEETKEDLAPATKEPVSPHLPPSLL